MMLPFLILFIVWLHFSCTYFFRRGVLPTWTWSLVEAASSPLAGSHFAYSGGSCVGLGASLASRSALHSGVPNTFLLLCLLTVLLDSAHAGCPDAAASGYFCVDSVERQCPTGSFCTGGSAGAKPCLTPLNCAKMGLSADPFCVWNVTTLAGNGSSSFANGQGAAATFNQPSGVAADGSGVVYVADYNNNCIRVVTSSGLVSTLAGSGIATWADGNGVSACFHHPYGVATYPSSGIIYVADTFNHRIRELAPSGATTTFAGSGTNSWADGQGTSASFHYPRGLAVDSEGAVYVADDANNRIRKITPLGAVTTLAGTGVSGSSDGAGTRTATFNLPYGVAVDGSGNVFVGDTANNLIRLILPDGTVSTFAGSGSESWADGTGTSAAFYSPRHLSLAANGNLLVADEGNHRIRMLTPLGVVTSIAGGSTASFINDFGTASLFNSPSGVTVTSAGTLYIGDSNSNRIRTLSCVALFCPAGSYCSSGKPMLCPEGYFCPLGAINPTPCPPGTYSNANGTTSSDACASACSPGFFQPFYGATSNASCIPCLAGYYGASAGLSSGSCTGACTAAPGSGCAAGSVSPANATQCVLGYFCPGGTPAPAIPCMTPANCEMVGLSAEPPCVWKVTTLAGSGGATFINGQGTAAAFDYPSGVAADASGLVYVADQFNSRIRSVTPYGLVSSLAGSGNLDWADGTGTAASFFSPGGIATFPGSGILYVADTGNNRIRKLTPSGVTTTFAGSGSATWADGQGTSAIFYNPSGLSVDSAGVVYVADYGNHRIRKITPTGAVTTLAGSGCIGYYPCFPPFANGVGTSTATFILPQGVAVDGSGNVYVGDTGNFLIRLILPNGTTSTFAGSGDAPWADGTGSFAAFNFPAHLSFAANGNLLVADHGNHRIRMITPLGDVTTIAGGSTLSFLDGYGTASLFYGPGGVTVNSAGTLYIGDSSNNRIRALICVTCPAGSYCSGGIVNPCPAGSFCPAQSTSPTPCPAGSYTSVPGRSGCVFCGPGLLAPKAGSTLCDDFCPIGTFRARPGGTNVSSCTPCPPGSFGEAEGGTDCTPCPFGSAGGMFTGAISSSVCTPCPPGSFSASLTGASVCTLCSPGSYSLSGASTCSPCPLGTFLASPGATSVTACIACSNGTSTLSPGSTTASQCIAISINCPLGTQPITSSPIYNAATECIPLVCPPPLILLPNSSSCMGCPFGTSGSPLVSAGAASQSGCIPCASPALCHGFTSMPLFDFLAMQHSSVPAPPPFPNITAAALLAACPMATLSLPAPQAPPPNLFLVYAQLLSGGGLLAIICTLSFFLFLFRSKVLDCLKNVDLFSDAHDPPPHAQHLPVPYPTHLGGMCSLWAVISLLSYATYLAQEFLSASNTLTQQSLAVLDDSLWLPPLAWSAAAPPWEALGDISTPPLTGVMVRLLLSGEPGACAAPQSWAAQGQGSEGWTLASTPSCTSTSPTTANDGGGSSGVVSQHTFSCPTCVLGDASALSAVFHFSCQALVLEAIAVPSYPPGTLSTRRADINATTQAYPQGGLLASLTWTVRLTPTQLKDNSSTHLPWGRSSATAPLGYFLSSQNLATTSSFPTSTTSESAQSGLPTLQPAAYAVNITVALPLQALVAVTQLTPITNFASLLAQLVGITGLLGFFRTAFYATEKAATKLLPGNAAVGGTGTGEAGEDKPGWGSSGAVQLRELQEGPPQNAAGGGLRSAGALPVVTPQLVLGAVAPAREEPPPLEEGLGLWVGREAKVRPLQPPPDSPGHIPSTNKRA
jgi:sugar lactone lactonase YvrE